MALKLPAALLAEIEAHARSAYPRECCGALLGAVPRDFAVPGREVRADAARPLANAWPEDGRAARYEADPAEIVGLERELRGTGRGIVGFYHSHPDVPAWPSPFDLLRAWPAYSYLIVSVGKGGRPDARSWMRSEDGRDFVGEPLTVEAAEAVR